MSPGSSSSTDSSVENTQKHLLIRTLAMPADTNANGDIFGGWIMSQMDIAGGIIAKEVTKGRTVTVAVDSMKFYYPVAVGDTVCCRGCVTNIGNTSITIAIEVWVTKSYAPSEEERDRKKVTEALFTYVAVDEDGNKRQITKD